MVPGNKSTLKIAALWILGFILVFSIVSIGIVKVIYDRQFPRMDRHDLSVTAHLRYEDLEMNYPRRLVTFTSGKNTLQGYLYGLDQDQGLVVVVHGLGGGADSYLAQITYFVDQGWRVFAYDATGSFDSEGKSTKGFPQQLIDLDAALTYLRTQSEFADLPILLFGHSWGGYAVANLLHYEHDIAAVVTASGANSAQEMIIEQGQRMMGRFVYTQYPYLWLYQRLLFGNVASLNAIDAINSSDTPVLIIHGTEDQVISYRGSSIMAHVDAITHPNVKSISLSEPGRNGHNDLFRSDASLDYIDQINRIYRELYDTYDQTIPYPVRQDFYEQVDRALVQELNLDLMNEIQAFFLESVAD